jgi:hypothetical protein
MMNSNKKEELKKKAEMRKGLTPAEIEQLDKQESSIKKQFEKARELHELLFPEETDFMWDSYADMKDRDRGINPMSKEYIERIKNKRDMMGVPQLTENGMPVDDTTYRLCVAEVRAEQEGKTTQWTERFKELKEQALEDKRKHEERLDELQRHAPGIDPTDPNTWTETMFKNLYELEVAVNSWELNDSIEYDEFKKKLFMDDNFRALHIPKSGMEKDDYN